MKKKIIVLYPNSLHSGAASTNRVIHICKALIKEGNIIKLYVTRPTEKNYNTVAEVKGIFEGIDFSFVNKSNIWPKSLIKKVFYQIFGIIRTSIILAKGDYDIVLSYADYNFFHHLIFVFFIKLKRKKLVYAVDEYPWHIIYNTNSNLNRLYMRFFYKLFDALIVMTFTLMDYYSTKIRKEAILYHLPMTVDLDRFCINQTVNTAEGGYIAYCGYDLYIKNGSIFSKDGVDILIEAFALISTKHPKISLHIIGESNKYRYQQVEKLKIKDRVIFTGGLNRDDIPKYLSKAKLLVLARPNNIQAAGAFPSKLGEYLATGKPVVVTKVGEIPFYLTDNKNAFLAEPGDIQSFAEKMDFALSNPEISKEVGLRGREIAENEFDYKIQSIKLNEFLTKLI
jgi:glycosyltransferase involved in cell wall biosynthesis